jgi:hypothetical protein
MSALFCVGRCFVEVPHQLHKHLRGAARLGEADGQQLSVCEELLLGARLYGLSADLHEVCQLEWVAHSIKEGVPLQRRVQVEYTGRVRLK